MSAISLKEFEANFAGNRIPGHEWKQQIAEMLDDAGAITETAKAAGRDVDADEAKKFDALIADVKVAQAKAAEAIAHDENRKAHALAQMGRGLGGNPVGSGPTFRTGEGHIVRALTRNESFARQASFGEEQTPRIGDMLAAMITGRYDNVDRHAIQNAIGSNDSAGGYTLNPALSGQIIDLARSASVSLRAGAATLPMSTAELSIARLNSDPTAYWRPEGVAVNSTDVTFDRVTLRPKTLAAIIPVSLELLEDAANIGSFIESTLQAALGLKLDQAVLRGSGAESEPLGILNHPTINSVPTVGAIDDYQEITSAVGEIYADNYTGEPESLAWIMNPREGKKYDSLEDTTGQPLQPTPWASKLKRLMTTSLLTTEGGGTDSSMIVGDFSQVVIGMRTSGVRIRIADDGTVFDGTNSINATSQLMKFIVAYLRADVAILRPSWMCKLTGVSA